MGKAFDDDDFGDLYADVEAHIVASFSNGNKELRSGNEFEFGASECESDEVSVPKPFQLHNVDGPGKEMMLYFEKDDDSSSDDSEDDLKILLNDEDCEGLPFTSSAGIENEEEGDGGGDGFVASGDDNVLECFGGEKGNEMKDSYPSQFKYIRPNAEKVSITSKSIGKDRVASDWEDKEWNKPRRSVSVQVVQKHNWGNGSVGQGGYSFSLPWSRSIFDVNIDVLENKPWRYPGVDATDFFNFGFNEQSWKNYCRSLAYEGGFQHKKLPQKPEGEEMFPDELADHVPKIDACEVNQFGWTKGKAIEVGGHKGERQPSMDLWHPCYSHRDSDVVIQIIGLDSKDSTAIDEQEVGGGDNDIYDAKEISDTDEGDDGDANYIASASGSEPSIDTLEGAERRSLQLKISSKSTSLESENHGKSQVSDPDRQRHEKNRITSEENIGAPEISSYRQEAVSKDLSCNDPCVIQTESSLGGCGHSSPKFLCSGDHSGDSEHVPYNGSEKKEKISLRPSPECVAILKRSPVVGSGSVGPSVFSDEAIHNQDHTIDYHGRHLKRVHGLNSYGKRNTTYYRISEGSHRNHGHGKTFGYYNQHSYETRFLRKNGRTFSGKRDPYPRKEWGRRKYLFQQNIDGVDSKIAHRHRYGYEKGYAVKDNCFTLTKTRGFGFCDSYYTNEEEDGQWKGRNELHYSRKRRIDPAEDFMPGNYESFQCTGRKMKFFDERYLPHGEEDMKSASRRKRLSDDTILDAGFPESMENRYDERGHVNTCSLSSQQYKESYYHDGRKWHDSRPVNDDVYELKSLRTYSRYHAQASDERYGGDWICSFDDICYQENINYPNNHLQPEIRRYGGQLKYDNTHTSSDKSKMHYGYKQLKQDRYEMAREKSTSDLIGAKLNSTYNGKYECKVQRYRDPLDRVFGEGQSSRRCSESATVISYDHGNSNLKWEEGSERKELTNFNDLDQSYAIKVQLDNEGRTLDKNNDKWPDKLSVEAVDIEEGQIVLNEPYEFMPTENVHAFERILLQKQNRSNENKLANEVDNSRILESLSKMKKRRERFKEPLTLKKEPEKDRNHQIDAVAETTEINLQRPARKRRWVGF